MAAFEPLHKGNDLIGVVQRLGYLVSGVAYALLVWSALGFVTGRAQPPQVVTLGSAVRQASAEIRSTLAGARWLVATEAVAVMGVAGSRSAKDLAASSTRRYPRTTWVHITFCGPDDWDVSASGGAGGVGSVGSAYVVLAPRRRYQATAMRACVPNAAAVLRLGGRLIGLGLIALGMYSLLIASLGFDRAGAKTWDEQLYSRGRIGSQTLRQAPQLGLLARWPDRPDYGRVRQPDVHRDRL